MKSTMAHLVTRVSKLIAPLALALAITTANATCYIFTYQPKEPESLKLYRASHKSVLLS